MTLGYTLKLMLSNFSNVWKLLLYKLICILCVLGLTTVVAWPIINVLIRENFFVNLQTSFEDMLFNLNIEKLFVGVDKTVKSFFEIVSANNYLALTIICGVVAVVLFTFLNGYASIAVHESINGYMSSLTRYGFTNAYVSNFGRATLFNLASLITIVPLNFAIWIGAYFMASRLYAKIGVIAIILTFLVLILLLTLKNTFFSGWKPALIVHNQPTFIALKNGVVAMSRRFFRTLSNYAIIILALLIINLFGLLLTAGVALVVTLPLSTLLCIILDQVSYYECMGMRFYTDGEHVITPKKLEQQDKFAKVKDII